MEAKEGERPQLVWSLLIRRDASQWMASSWEPASVSSIQAKCQTRADQRARDKEPEDDKISNKKVAGRNEG